MIKLPITMNILFLYPEQPEETFWSMKYSLDFLCSKAVYPPLGLLTVAAMMPEKWDKKFIDMNVKPLEDDDIIKSDMVFIGAMTVQSEGVLKIIKRCKALNKKIVAGGPMFSSYKKGFKGIDHVL